MKPISGIVFSPAINLLNKGEKRITISGLWSSTKAYFLAHLEAPLLIIADSIEKTEKLAQDFVFFKKMLFNDTQKTAFLLSTDSSKVAILYRLAKGEHLALFAASEVLESCFPSKDMILKQTITVAVSDNISRDEIGLRLIELGYRSVPLVTETGEFSIRGNIIDVFPPYHEYPCRIELFGDNVESIRDFDVSDQRSKGFVDRCVIPPLDLESGTVTTSRNDSTIFDYISSDTLVVFDELSDFISHLTPYTSHFTVISIELLGTSHEEGIHIHFNTESIESQGLRGTPKNFCDFFGESRVPSRISVFCEKIKEWLRHYRVIVVCHTEKQITRIRDIFMEYGIFCELMHGRLSGGFIFADAGIVIVTENDIFGEKIRKAIPRRVKTSSFLSTIEDLKGGDYVVHVDHGIGRYMGLKRLRVGGACPYESDFMLIEYAGSDRLYVPLEGVDRVQKYIGSEGTAPKLDRLGVASWERTKARIKKEMAEIAGELLELYACREVLDGYAFSEDNYLHKEFDASFIYEETPDQITVIEETKKDMESQKPMDRLVCGDVGYGKTEVAARAAFKAVYDGKQVAVIVPTTLLSEQHYNTFRERFSQFPVKIESLSRLKTKKQQSEMISALRHGMIDIIIGTHRILQKDVVFKNLGLVIIDEEHRFGVTHKEMLKNLRKNIDVLTLTATPIPRTLNMALSGVRDMSIIDTPPPDRKAVETVIARFSPAVIREAILKEVQRGGQVFFVHNRIHNIKRIEDYLKGIVPEVRMAVVHGRMNERKLEDVMLVFLRKEIDLLISTAIIESGLDIPSVNTIIVNRADKFGLAELYQLRGRVGRSKEKGYAYLLIPGEKIITEEARKRLKAIEELSELGAGFRLALRDLEIRGAGNILGREQSGYIDALGFDLYLQLLEKTILELRGEKVAPEVETIIDLKVSAFIPEEYIPDAGQRLIFYKRIASAQDIEDLIHIKEELNDRYGRIPAEVSSLLEAMDIKILAKRLMVCRIEYNKDKVRLSFDKDTEVPSDKIFLLWEKLEKRLKFSSEYTIEIETGIEDPEVICGWDWLYREIKNYLQELL
ncbi:MAG: transcription-repair coupling factor [Nitrospirota bacterium]